MRRRSIADEKLTAVRVRPFVGHAHDSARVVPQRRADLVFKGGFPDGGAGFGGCGGGGAGLDHEVWEGAVEGGGVVGG